MPPPPTEVFASRLFLGPALRAQPDGRLVTLVREGYEAAFEEIVRRYGRPLTRYAASIVGSRSEDVTQDAFSKALTALRRNDNEIDLRPWLYRIVRNTALNDLRDRPPTTEILEEAIAAGRGTAAEAEEREQLRELVDRLRALPERQRAAIVMRELEGLSHREIAAALGLSGGAVRQVIFRAREAVRGGAGMLVPLPLMRLLLEYGPEATAGAGVLAAGGAAGGAGTALKAGAVAAIIAGSLGTGIALQHDQGQGGQADAATLRGTPTPGTRAGAPGQAGTNHDDSGTDGETGAGDGGNRGPDGDGGDDSSGRHRSADSSGPGSGHGGSGGGPQNSGPGNVGGTSGPGGGDDRSGSGDRHGGDSETSGESGGSSGSGSSGGGVDDNSGPGGGGSGSDDHSGPGGGGGTDDNSGPGDGSTVSEPAPTTTTTSDGGGSGSSGSGSGESVSGTSGSGSSGQGSGDSLESGSSGSGSGDPIVP